MCHTRAGAHARSTPLPVAPAVAIIYIALVTFTFLIYAAPNSNVGLGSINRVYDNLARIAE